MSKFSKLLDDDKVVAFANTEKQEEHLQAYQTERNTSAAAEAIGISRQALERSLGYILKRAEIGSYEPEKGFEALPPEAHTVSGYSTLTRFPENDPHGRVIQWHKTKPDEAKKWKQIDDYLSLRTEELPQYEPTPAPAAPLTDDLLNLYTVADAHIGMLAWAKETGADWDLKIADETITKCFEFMVNNSPDAETCVVADLGDWMHYDSLLPVTPSSGHVLDSDSRAAKMADVAIDVFLKLVQIALGKHNKVIIVMAEGNHNLFSSMMMRKMVIRLFANEPRVEVIDQESPYYAYEFGKTMLTFHHGHIRKPEQLPLKIATMFSGMWGRTKFRYGHTGHLHHKIVKEHDGITMEQHGTLAAADAHAARGAWLSLQQAESICYHREFGEAGRVRVSPSMVGVNY